MLQSEDRSMVEMPSGRRCCSLLAADAAAWWSSPPLVDRVRRMVIFGVFQWLLDGGFRGRRRRMAGEFAAQMENPTHPRERGTDPLILLQLCTGVRGTLELAASPLLHHPTATSVKGKKNIRLILTTVAIHGL